MTGCDQRYEKSFDELSGLYRDHNAYEIAREKAAGKAAYWVESNTLDPAPGGLTIGVSVLLPGLIGREFAMTRGHLHRRSECAELYYGLSGRGVMLLDSLAGETRAVPISEGVAVHVPGGWIHRSVNVGDENLVTLFCYETSAGQDYELIEQAGGMKCLVVESASGWALERNPDHRGYRAN